MKEDVIRTSSKRRLSDVGLTPPGGMQVPALESLEQRLLLSAALTTVNWQGQSVQAVADQYVVRFTHSEVKTTRIAGDLQAYGYNQATVDNLGGGLYAVIDAPGATINSLTTWAATHPNVVAVEPNFVHGLSTTTIPTDDRFDELWAMNNTRQAGGIVGADIDAPEAWSITTGSSDVVIAVIDTGIDYTHPDLVSNMWTNPGEVADDGIDNDGNGYIDDIHGWDFANNDNNPRDGHGHGTHTAGTIGASAGDGNIVGVNWNVSLMAMKFLSDSGSGSTSNAIRAINYITMMKNDFGINVVVANNSWGGGGYSYTLNAAIAAAGQAGILFVAAAGNDGENTDYRPHYPSSYNQPNVISVAATTASDALASFSNYGATSVDLGAPGQSILSTLPGGRYGSWSGTSMAAPHVAGVAGLLAAADPSASIAEIKAAILAGAEPISSLDGKTVTGGRLNAFNSLELLDVGDTQSPRIVGYTPSGLAGPTDQIRVQFSEAMAAESVTAVAFDLVEAGPDGQFDTGDDVSIAIADGSVGLTSPNTVTLTLPQALAQGGYRLTVRGDGVADLAGNPINNGLDETHTFAIVVIVSETESNRTTAEADLTGLTGVGAVMMSGRIADAADIDLFAFTAGAGQTVVADLDRTGGQSDFTIRLFTSRGREMTFARGGDDGDGLQWAIESAGTYYVGISGWGNHRYNARHEAGERTGEVGDYLLNLSLAESAATITSGVDAFGYQAQTRAFNFEDINGIGRARVSGLADDVSFGILVGSRVGFEFDLYGERAERFLASSNGHVSFDSGSNHWSNSDLAAAPRAALAAALWDDLFIDPAGGNILVAVRGGRNAPDQRLIVQWDNVRFYGGGADETVTFQAVLSEADNSIRFNYLDLAVSGSHGGGGSATAGIRAYGDQTVTGNYLAVSYNNTQSPFVGTGHSTVITLGDPAPAARTMTADAASASLGQIATVSEPDAVLPAASIDAPVAADDFTFTNTYAQTDVTVGESRQSRPATNAAGSDDEATEDDGPFATLPALRTIR